MFVSSIQTKHRILQKILRNIPCKDGGNVHATFLVILRKIFLQGCENIGLKIF